MSNTIYSVLVTRPAHQNSDLIQSIEAMGHRALILPTLRIEHNINRNINLERYLKINLKNGNPCFIIITSQNALWALSSIELALIKQYHKQYDSALYIITMGQATSRLAKTKGLRVHYTALRGYTSEDLLSIDILQGSHIKDQPILILTGENSPSPLVHILSSRAAKVDTLLLYKRQDIQYEPNKIQTILKPWLMDSVTVRAEQTEKIIFISSQAGFDNLLKIIFNFKLFNLALALELYRIPVVVPSARIERYVLSRGFERVYLSPSAHDADMLSVLKELRSIRK